MRWTGLFGAFSCWATTASSLLLLRWQGRQDLNLQPSALETDALPLSYSPKELDDLAAGLCGYSSAVLNGSDRLPQRVERGKSVPRCPQDARLSDPREHTEIGAQRSLRQH